VKPENAYIGLTADSFHMGQGIFLFRHWNSDLRSAQIEFSCLSRWSGCQTIIRSR
jgi:hypothetical protein